jgi:protein-disulfide isomerase
MRFEGNVYYDFSPRVWRFYRFLAAAGKKGADLRLDWRSFLADDDPQSAAGLALVETVRRATPERHGVFLQALLALRHIEGADLTDPRTAAAAAEATGLSGVIEPSPEAVVASTEAGTALGVTGTPTIHRHGPVLRVDVNPAAYEGDVLERLSRINDVMEDDGIWVLEKP